MMPKVSTDRSPQRLVEMLSDVALREDQGWRKRLIEPPKDRSQDISPEDRDLAVVWISQLAAHFKFTPETFALSVVTLDRFIHSVKVRPKYLKCIALTCFYLASKFIEEEEYVPGTREFIENSDCGCRVQDVVRMERIVLTKLNWNIHVATTLDYLQILHTMACTQQQRSRQSIKQQSRDLSRITLELQQVLSHYAIASYNSVTLALAILSLDLELISDNSTHWVATTSQLQTLTKVATAELMSCREKVCAILPHKAASPLLSNRVYIVKANTGQVTSSAKKRKLPSNAVVKDISNSIKKLHTNDLSSDNFMLSTDEQTVTFPDPSATADDGLATPSELSHRQKEKRVRNADVFVATEYKYEQVLLAPDPLATRDYLLTPPPDLMQPLTPETKSPQTLNTVTAPLDVAYSDDDSDATMTASEGEEDDDRSETRLRPLTYAEIVKCGILNSADVSIATDLSLATLNALAAEACC